MIKLEKLDTRLCSLLNASAIVSMYGSNSCSVEDIETSCFASEKCMYDGGASNLDVLLHSSYAYVCRENDTFCACVAANKCKDGNVPHFFNVRCSRDSLFLHTLCVENNYRKNGLATRLLNKIKKKNKPIYLIVLNGNDGRDYRLKDFFKNRSEKLLNFYRKNGFKLIKTSGRFELMKYDPQI